MEPQIQVETAAVLGVAALVALWLVSRLRTPGYRLPALSIVLLALVVAAWTAAWSREPPPPKESEVFYRPIADPSGGYVSSGTCRACHPSQHASWSRSYHRTMTQVVTVETMLGQFDGRCLEYHGTTYCLQRDDDLFFYQALGPDGTEIARRPLVLSTGSHHMQAYWAPTLDGRAVEFFPFIWLIPEARWVPRESVFLQPTVPVDVPLRQRSELEEWQENRQWNHSCIHCHTTRGEPRFPEVDTRVAEFGIACEACHGPAAEHAARNRDPLRRYRLHLSDADDASVVEPSRLATDRASEVCGVCHGITSALPGQEEQEMIGGRSFRPGDELSATRVVCRGGDDSARPEACSSDVGLEHRYWSDGMLRVSGREYVALLDSPCHADGSFSCLSCHRMHAEEGDPESIAEWADDQLGPGMEGDGACLQCHDTFGSTEALEEHTRHLGASSGSRCYNCHMPYTSYGLLKAIRSHQVSSPSVTSSLETGRPNACNQCHLDRTLAWSAAALERWYGIPQPTLDGTERGVPASLVWLLSGDAGQRALMAWTMGWEPALEISGEHWTTPYLTQLLADPYDAVRLIAERSLRRRPGFEEMDYDFLAPPRARVAAAAHIRQHWIGLPAPPGEIRDARSLLDDPDRTLPDDVFSRLLAERDDRVVILTE